MRKEPVLIFTYRIKRFLSKYIFSRDYKKERHMEQYCIYLRKSRADIELEAKGEMETLSRHKKILLELGQTLKLPVTKIYEEIVSGETIESRPVVRRLLDEVGRGIWRGVLVMEIERLARGDTVDQGIVARMFKLGRAKIITPVKIYDPENEFDEEYFEFGLFMSRREYKTINRRIQRGRLISVKEGKFIGSTPPFGYDKVRIQGDKGYTLAPNEQSSVVRTVFELYASGVPISQIACRLDAFGIKPPKAETWSKSTLNDMLANPVYTGRLRWAYRRETKFLENGEIKTRRQQNGEPVLVKGLHRAIVSDELFEKVQKMRARNTHSKTKKSLSLQNPLAGIVYCKICGRMMTRLGPGTARAHPRLICPNRACGNISAPLSAVEEKLITALSLWLEGYRLDFSACAPVSACSPVLEKALNNALRELDTLKAQMSNAHDLLEQGVYSAELFAARSDSLSVRIEKAKEKIETISEQIAKQPLRYDKTKLPKKAGALCRYQNLKSAKDKNDILRLFVSRVEYRKSGQNTKGGGLNPNFELFVYPKLAQAK
jgi:site-specific DNA recombinase